jgi:hypothetical protein
VHGGNDIQIPIAEPLNLALDFVPIDLWAAEVDGLPCFKLLPQFIVCQELGVCWLHGPPWIMPDRRFNAILRMSCIEGWITGTSRGE